MEKIEQGSFAKDLIVVVIIAEFFSTLTLWLVESTIRYPLFIFETISIIAIYLILRDYDFNFSRGLNLTKRIPQGFILDVLLIYSSIFLIFLNILHIESIIQLILAFLCASFLSGYAFLNICNITKYFSRLEVLVLSYLASFVFSGFLTLILLWSSENMRFIFIASLFILLGILSAVRHFKNKGADTSRAKSLSKNIDILPIVLSITFYVTFFYYMYPNFTLLPASDISRNYQNSIILSRSPDLYTGFTYILFHAFDSALNVLSGLPSMTLFQTIHIILNIFLPLSVYTLAKRFFENVDRRIPAISTLFYTTLSNFAFIYFSQLKMAGTGNDLLHVLGTIVGQKAYFGLVYSLQPFAWFSASPVALIMFCIAFLLMSVHNIPRSRFLPLFTILILAMYLTHVAEAVIFVIFVAAYSLISKSKTLRINDALLSSLIAFILAIAIHVYTSIFWESDLRIPEINFRLFLATIVPILSVIFSLFWRQTIQDKIHFSTRFTNSKGTYMILSTIITSVYLLGFFTWFFIDDFKSTSVYYLGVVPWFIYPLLLGIVGLLSILTIRYLGEILPNSFVAIVLASIPFMLFIGQLVSFININFFATGFWEKRLLLYIFLAISLTAPIALIKFVDGHNLKKILPNITCSVIIALIVLSGFSSTALQSEYWYLKSNSNPSNDELHAVEYLKNILQQDTRAFTISPSQSSRSMLVFAIPAYEFTLPEISIFSKYPDMPLFTLTAHNLPHAYIYMHDRDFDMLKDKESWFIEHLIPMLPVIFSNDQVVIYNASHVSYPLPNSETTMIIPTDSHIVPQNSWFYAYDIISQGNINYTIMYDKDPNALTSKTVILSYDPIEKNNSQDLNDLDLKEQLDYVSYVKSGGNLVVFNTNGYGSISNSLLTILDPPFEANKISIPSGNAIPINITLNETHPTSENVIPLSFYTSPQGKSSILLAEETVGLGKITLLNVYPILSGFKENRVQGAELYQMLGKISEVMNFKKNDSLPESVTDIKVIFKEMNGTGNVVVNTTSVIFPSDINLKEIIIQDGHEETLITNVTKLNIEGYSRAILHTDYISLANGRGLYANLDLSDSLDMLFAKNAKVEAVSNNNELFHIDNATGMTIMNNVPVYLYARQPTIEVHGNTTLTEPSGAQLYAITRQQAQGLEISGNVSLTLLMSDSYNFGSYLFVDGITERVPPLYQYDQLSSFQVPFLQTKLTSVPLFVAGLLIIPFFIAAIFLCKRKPKS